MYEGLSNDQQLSYLPGGTAHSFDETADFPNPNRYDPRTFTFDYRPELSLSDWLTTRILASNPSFTTVADVIGKFPDLAGRRIFAALQSSHEHVQILGSKSVCHGQVPIIISGRLLLVHYQIHKLFNQTYSLSLRQVQNADTADLQDFVEEQTAEMLQALVAITDFVVPLFSDPGKLMNLSANTIAEFVRDEHHHVNSYTRQQVLHHIEGLQDRISSDSKYPLVSICHWLTINETAGRLFDLATMINVFRAVAATAGRNDNYMTLLSIRMHSFGNKLQLISQGMHDLHRAGEAQRWEQHRRFFGLFTLVAEDLEMLANLTHKGVKATSIRDSDHLWTALQAVYDKSLLLDLEPGIIINRNLDKLAEILFEVVLNAWKYSLSPEALSILKDSARTPKHIALKLKIEGGYVVVTVQDYGIGISETIDPITGRGANVDKIPGTGIGMRGVRQELHLMEGTLDAKPNPEGGTIVDIHIPIGQLISGKEAEV